MPHTNLVKVTSVVFVNLDPVLMSATNITLASQMFPVLIDTAISVAHKALKFGIFPQSGLHVSD